MKRLLLPIFLLLSVIAVYPFEQSGMASWYGPNFHGKKTANGEIFNTYALTAAHRSLPLNSVVKVISLENNKEVVVRINDRGPFAKGRIIDLSKAAAAKLGVLHKGTMRVKIVLLKEGDNKYYRYTPGKYIIQVASFSKRERALAKHDLLTNIGLKPAVTEVRVNGKTLYRVEIRDLTYGMLHSQKIALHNAGINTYLIKKQV